MGYSRRAKGGHLQSSDLFLILALRGTRCCSGHLLVSPDSRVVCLYPADWICTSQKLSTLASTKGFMKNVLSFRSWGELPGIVEDFWGKRVTCPCVCRRADSRAGERPAQGPSPCPLGPLLRVFEWKTEKTNRASGFLGCTLKTSECLLCVR